MIAYIVAGIILGPSVAGVLKDTQSVSGLGELGLLLLMFFLGMEIDIPDNKSRLLKPVVAQIIKTLLSMGGVMAIGYWQSWSPGIIIVTTMLLVFNSTAVITEFMRMSGDLYSDIGKAVLNILLLQDVMLAPALTILQFAGNHEIQFSKLLFSGVACTLLFFILRAIRNRNLYQLPFLRQLDQEHELQVFSGLLICIGFAWVASAIGLSETIGSFAAGLVIGRTKAFHWLENSLRPFKIFFVALFFVSVGLSMDLIYIRENYKLILALTIAIFVINSLLSAAVFRVLQYRWRDSLYAGGLLSQTGEFGIVACSLAYKMAIIPEALFKACMAITGLSLLCSTVWIALLRKIIFGTVNKFTFQKIRYENSILNVDKRQSR